MKTFKVRITETLEKVVEVQAETENEALQLVDDNYRAAQDDYILGADNFTGVDFKVEEECQICSEMRQKKNNQRRTTKDWSGGNASVFISIGASNHSATDRQEDDYYATDPIAIDKLLNAGAKINNSIWECACGGGHLAKRLCDNGFTVYATDIVDRGFGTSGIDFLKQTEIFDGDILTNPPYKFAKEFLVKALSLIENGHKVFMLLKLTFLESKSRLCFL